MFHWYIHRATSVLLLPAIIFSGYQLYSAQPYGSGSMIVFFVNLFILLTVTYHLKLGLDSIIEDYVHNPQVQLIGKLLLNLSCIFIVKVLILL